MKRFLALALLSGAMLGLGGVGCNNNKPASGTGGKDGTGTKAVTQVKKLNVGGASFISPMMEKWSYEYKKAKGTEINYASVGSGAGIKGLIDRTYDYCCSDAPLNDKQLEDAKKSHGDVVHIPQAMGAVVAAYHLEGVAKPLNLTGEILADIYLGKIKKWNDPAITGINKDANLPDKDIAVCYRSDGSGTTYTFVEYLADISPEFKEKVGVGTSVKFPVGNGAPRNDGVANLVKTTDGAIGYIELIFALGNNIPAALIKNKEGNFVKGDLDSVTAAAAGALTKIPDDLRFSLVNAPGKDSYPISGVNWAISYTKVPANKRQAIVDFLTWVTHDGQQYCKDLHYSALPKGLIERVEKNIASIQAE
jgi:phosphate transport system substrate-binding protein